jgi:hypothetical protein
MQEVKSNRRPATGDPAAQYVQFIQDMWTTVCPLIGAITLSVLVLSCFRRVSRDHDFLGPVTVTMEGVDATALLEALRKVDAKRQAAAMGELTKQLLSVFESIAGPIIVRQLMPLTMRLDQLISAQREKA